MRTPEFRNESSRSRFGQQLVIEFDVGEDRRARLEANRRAALVRLADQPQGATGSPESILLLIDPTFAADGQHQVLGKGVDD